MPVEPRNFSQNANFVINRNEKVTIVSVGLFQKYQNAYIKTCYVYSCFFAKKLNKENKSIVPIIYRYQKKYTYISFKLTYFCCVGFFFFFSPIHSSWVS